MRMKAHDGAGKNYGGFSATYIVQPILVILLFPIQEHSMCSAPIAKGTYQCLLLLRWYCVDVPLEDYLLLREAVLTSPYDPAGFLYGDTLR